MQEEQQESVLGGGLPVRRFTQTLLGSAEKLKKLVEKLLNVLQILLSFTFITIFIQSAQFLRLLPSGSSPHSSGSSPPTAPPLRLLPSGPPLPSAPQTPPLSSSCSPQVLLLPEAVPD